MKIRHALLAALLLVGLASTVRARFAPQDVEAVPVERLADNARAYLEAHADDAEGWYVLARLYSMAYAQGDGSVRVVRPDEDAPAAPSAEAGPPEINVPRGEHKCGVVRMRAAGSQEHLDKAIDAYREAARLAPNEAKNHLGLAWCLEEKGQLDASLAAYRRAWSAGREHEDLEHICSFCASISEEAGQALVRLLSEHGGDAEEIAAVQAHLSSIVRPRRVTPVIVPLTAATHLDALVTPAEVTFDLDGDGAAERWSWVTPEAGVLVWDPHERATITSGTQLFGSATWWIFWEHGYQPLAYLDDDRDGWLTGDELVGIRVWCDGDGDGVSSPGEVRSLEHHAIVGLGVLPTGDLDGQPMHAAGVQMSDGSTRPSYDWHATRGAGQ